MIIVFINVLMSNTLALNKISNRIMSTITYKEKLNFSKTVKNNL